MVKEFYQEAFSEVGDCIGNEDPATKNHHTETCWEERVLWV